MWGAKQRRSVFGAVAAGALAFTLAGCAGGTDAASVSSQMSQMQSEGGQKQYTNTKTVTSIPVGERGEIAPFEGVDEDGNPIASQDFVGNVTVVNFWYAACPPCRAEATEFAASFKKFQGEGVRFLGVNVRDGSAQAKQFTQQYGIEYPSIMDVASQRAAQRAFAASVALNATPTTLILDRAGRVAHRIVGQIAAQSQLDTLIQETLREQ